MQDVSTMQMACKEREDFGNFLDERSSEQWEQPSLCELMRTSIPPRGLASAFGGMIALWTA